LHSPNTFMSWLINRYNQGYFCDGTPFQKVFLRRTQPSPIEFWVTIHSGTFLFQKNSTGYNFTFTSHYVCDGNRNIYIGYIQTTQATMSFFETTRISREIQLFFLLMMTCFSLFSKLTKASLNLLQECIAVSGFNQYIILFG
jgi:hypothetical protein